MKRKAADKRVQERRGRAFAAKESDTARAERTCSLSRKESGQKRSARLSCKSKAVTRLGGGGGGVQRDQLEREIEASGGEAAHLDTRSVSPVQLPD